jgi:hypothetical protein
MLLRCKAFRLGCGAAWSYLLEEVQSNFPVGLRSGVLPWKSTAGTGKLAVVDTHVSSTSIVESA